MHFNWSVCVFCRNSLSLSCPCAEETSSTRTRFEMIAYTWAVKRDRKCAWPWENSARAGQRMCSSLMHLLIMVKESCAVFFLNALVLVLMDAGVSGLSGRGAGGQPAEQLVHHGNILSPLLKALSEHEPWGTDFPRTRPDSRYVRFMKRLYKLSTKHERSHEASHLYNTVRLITARQECLDQCGGTNKTGTLQRSQLLSEDYLCHYSASLLIYLV